MKKYLLMSLGALLVFSASADNQWLPDATHVRDGFYAARPAELDLYGMLPWGWMPPLVALYHGAEDSRELWYQAAGGCDEQYEGCLNFNGWMQLTPIGADFLTGFALGNIVRLAVSAGPMAYFAGEKRASILKGAGAVASLNLVYAAITQILKDRSS